jgi:hypothetical protein
LEKYFVPTGNKLATARGLYGCLIADNEGNSRNSLMPVGDTRRRFGIKVNISALGHEQPFVTDRQWLEEFCVR